MAAVCHKFVVTYYLSAYSEPNRFLLAGSVATTLETHKILLRFILQRFTKGKETKVGKDVFEVIANFGDVRNSVPELGNLRNTSSTIVG